MKRATHFGVMVLALVMCLALLPATAMAADAEEASEVYTEQAESEEVTLGGDDNDELFSGYVDQAFGINESGTAVTPPSLSKSLKAAPSAKSKGSRLTVVNLKVYNALKTDIAEVAAGSLSSTEFSIPLSDIGVNSGPYTADDFGLKAENYESTKKLAAAVFEKAEEKTGIEIKTVLDALQADCPYELYWWDKTKPTNTSIPYTWSTTSDGSTLIGVTFEDGNENKVINVKMPVAADYAASGKTGTYKFNTTIPERVTTAVKNAKEIIEENNSASDYEKLVAYRQKICSLVSYNNNAASSSYSGGYGDPWQLIYVFDGNDNTNVVCEGYAKAFKYLCDQSTFNSSNIYCYLAAGTMQGGTGSGAHMWNIVTMDDNKDYLVDVTNCDEGSIGSPDLLFLKGYTKSQTATITDSNDKTYTSNAYTFTINNTSITYVYDPDTLSNSGDELKISATNYTIPSFETQSLVLSGQIGVNFFVDIPERYRDSSYMTFTISGKGTTTKQDDYDATFKNTSGNYYGFTCYVNSIQMADTITATFHYSDKQTIKKDYSIKSYLKAFDEASSSYDESTVAMIKSIADYGHYAQLFLSDTNGWTIGTDYADMDTHYTNSYDVSNIKSSVSDYAFSKEITSSDIDEITYSLSLDSETTVNVFIKLKSDYNGNFAVTMDGSSYNAAKQSDGRYLVKISGISAHKLGDKHIIKVTTDSGNASISVSALSYVHVMLSSDSATEKCKNAMAAIYTYYTAVQNYRSKHS